MVALVVHKIYRSGAAEVVALRGLDLAVARGDSVGGRRLGLSGALELYMGRPVDVVVLNRAPVDLVHRVLRDGQLLCDRDPSARIRFEVQARNAYFDLLPYLRQYRRAVRSADA